MRKPLVLALAAAALAALTALPAGAEVIRCADAAGKVSYTNGECPAGARQVGRVAEPPASLPSQQPAPSSRSRDAAVASPPAPTAPAPQATQAPAGPIVIDPRAAANSTGGSNNSRWSDRGSDEPVYIEDGNPYPGVYGGGYRRPPPPRDMRPRIRNCDAGGCQDTMGNRYDRSGQLNNYRSLDGRTCQTVGTTQVCR